MNMYKKHSQVHKYKFTSKFHKDNSINSIESQ